MECYIIITKTQGSEVSLVRELNKDMIKVPNFSVLNAEIEI
jgi:hypothetical protein